MPRADKATFIQNMLSELEHKQNGSAPATPAPDSKEWWREVAQGLGVEVNRSRAALTAAEQQVAELQKRALPVIDPDADDTMGQTLPITQSRLFDLVRYARYWLQEENVISMGEWTWLTMAATGEGTGSVSRNRLEENDALRTRAEKAEAARDAAREETARVREERDEWDSKCQSLQVAIRNLTEAFNRAETSRDDEREKASRAREAIESYIQAVDADTESDYNEAYKRVAVAVDGLRAALTPTPPQPAPPEEVQPHRAATCVACGRELKGYSPNDTSTWRTDDFCSARCKRRGQPAARTEEG